MDWYGQLLVCSMLSVFPSSMAPSSPRASRRAKPLRFLSLSGEAVHAFVLPSYAHLNNSKTLISCSLTRAGLFIGVTRQMIGLPITVVRGVIEV
jgi:hypothetical protein